MHGARGDKGKGKGKGKGGSDSPPDPFLRTLDTDAGQVFSALLVCAGRRAGGGLLLLLCKRVVVKRLVVSTPAVVVLEDRGAVVLGLAQALVHLVVDETAPHSSALA